MHNRPELHDLGCQAFILCDVTAVCIQQRPDEGVGAVHLHVVD